MGKLAKLLRQHIWNQKNLITTTIFMLGEFLHIGDINVKLVATHMFCCEKFTICCYTTLSYVHALNCYDE